MLDNRKPVLTFGTNDWAWGDHILLICKESHPSTGTLQSWFLLPASKCLLKRIFPMRDVRFPLTHDTLDLWQVPSEGPVKMHLHSKQRLQFEFREASSRTGFCKLWPRGLLCTCDWNAARPVCWHIVNGCFCAVTSSCDRNQTTCKAENNHFLTHQPVHRIGC